MATTKKEAAAPAPAPKAAPAPAPAAPAVSEERFAALEAKVDDLIKRLAKLMSF